MLIKTLFRHFLIVWQLCFRNPSQTALSWKTLRVVLKRASPNACVFLQSKTGPFSEHSSTLYSIKSVPHWQKVYTGCMKMYKAEVSSHFSWVPTSLWTRSFERWRITDFKNADIMRFFFYYLSIFPSCFLTKRISKLVLVFFALLQCAEYNIKVRDSASYILILQR